MNQNDMVHTGSSYTATTCTAPYILLAHCGSLLFINCQHFNYYFTHFYSFHAAANFQEKLFISAINCLSLTNPRFIKCVPRKHCPKLGTTLSISQQTNQTSKFEPNARLIISLNFIYVIIGILFISPNILNHSISVSL